MAHQHHRDDVEDRLWKEVEKTRIGMLGLTGGPSRHMQPMTAFVDEAAPGTIWFYVRKDADIARTAIGGHEAMFNLMTKDHDFVTCIGGTLTPEHDEARIAKFWNPVSAAWFPEGKDDPNLTLLRFDASDAEVWLSQGGPIRFAWEVAKANVTKTQPDVGERRSLDL